MFSAENFTQSAKPINIQYLNNFWIYLFIYHLKDQNHSDSYCEKWITVVTTMYSFQINRTCQDDFIPIHYTPTLSCMVFTIWALPYEIVSGHSLITVFPVSILYKSIAGRNRPVRVADGPITARYRFIKNASWWTLSTNRIIRYYRMYEWRAKSRMVLCIYAGWSESAHLPRHSFASCRT